MRATKIWTWDRGLRAVDMDGEQELLAPILETVLSGCLWEELEKFPPKTVRRLLPRVIIPSNIRRLAEIWIEEREGSATRLAVWQERALVIVSQSSLARELVFGGRAALAAVHLHHRTSEDLDFFLTRQLDPAALQPIVHQLTTPSTRVDFEVVGPRTSLLLKRRKSVIGKIDFAYYPYDPIGRRTTWRGFTIEALGDMTVNKVQAVLTRFQPRDFVDLFFLLQEGPERDLVRLLDYARAKFDIGTSKMGLAARLLLVHDVRDLPKMIRSVDIPTLVEFFEARARELIGKK